MKEYRKNQSSNVLKKKKENNELQSVEVGVVTYFIKDKVEIFLMLNFISMIMTEIGPLNLFKTRVTGNKILEMCNGAF